MHFKEPVKSSKILRREIEMLCHALKMENVATTQRTS